MVKFTLSDSEGISEDEFDTLAKAVNSAIEIYKDETFEWVEIKQIYITTLFEEIMKVYPEIQGTAQEKFDNMVDYIFNQISEDLARRYNKLEDEILPIIEDPDKLKQMKFFQQKLYCTEREYTFEDYQSILKFKAEKEGNNE